MRIRAVRSESSLGAFWIAKDAKFHHVDNEDRRDCADAQPDLSLRWAHMPEGTFYHVAALIGKDWKATHFKGRGLHPMYRISTRLELSTVSNKLGFGYINILEIQAIPKVPLAGTLL